jgi:nucleolar pre-ribosomal-associated protein 1
LNVIEAVKSLDPAQMFRTCLAFPTWRTLADQTSPSDANQDAQRYDPVFVMLLFACVLNEGSPSSAFDWVEVFRTNIVSLLIRCLSSKDSGVRDMALCQVAALWKNLEVSSASCCLLTIAS